MENIEVLGAQIVNELMGADAGGLTPQFGINAAAELLNRGVTTYEQKEAAKKEAANQAAALARALATDISWANAEVMLEQANTSKDAQKISAASSLRQSAETNAMSARIGLSDDSERKRQQAADDMAKQSAEKSFAQPGNAGLAAAMRAWQKVSSARGLGAGGALTRYTGGGGGSFLDAMKKKYAGIPLAGWLVGVPVITFGLWKLVKSLRKGRK